MTKIYAYAIGVLLLVIAIGGAWWYVDSLRHAAVTAEAKQAAAEASVGTCAAALVQANDATAAAVAQAKAQREQAQSVIDAATTQKGKNNAVGALFAKKIADSAKTLDCQSVLEATLCPALSGY